MTVSLEQQCIDKNMRMTEQRKIIAQVLSKANDHPDVEELYQRIIKIDKNISIATVYRTIRMFEEAGIIEKHDFGDGRARYEVSGDDHHDHIIDIKSGKVIEFFDAEIERLQEEIVAKYGYKLVDHRLELYVVPIEDN